MQTQKLHLRIYPIRISSIPDSSKTSFLPLLQIFAVYNWGELQLDSWLRLNIGKILSLRIGVLKS